MKNPVSKNPVACRGLIFADFTGCNNKLQQKKKTPANNIAKNGF